jgi:hypothetical protein
MILDHCLEINHHTHGILYWSAWRHACNLINLSLHLPLSIFFGPKVVAISSFYLLLSKLLANSDAVTPASLKEQLREFQLFNKECFAWLENLFINCPGSVSISFLPVSIGEGGEEAGIDEYFEGSQEINESNERALAFLLSYCIDK